MNVRTILKTIHNKEELKSFIKNGGNPFGIVAECYIDYKDGEEFEEYILDAVTEMICYALTYNNKSDPLWSSSAKDLLKSVVFYLLESSDRIYDVTPLAIYRFIERYESDTNSLDELLKGCQSPLCIRAYQASNYGNFNFLVKELQRTILSTLLYQISVFKAE